MKYTIVRILIGCAVAMEVLKPAYADTVLKEDYTVAAEGVHTLRLKGITHTDLSYKGVADTASFTVQFEKRAFGVDDRRAEEVLSRIRLEIVNRDGVVEIIMIHPDDKTPDLVKRVIDKSDWRTTIVVTGPPRIDLDIDAGFSTVRTTDTNGTLTLSTDFTDNTVGNHTGGIDAKTKYGALRVERLDGAFTANGSFSDISIAMSGIGGNCFGRTSFSRIDLTVPKGAGAEIRTNASFGKTKFYLDSIQKGGERSADRLVIGGGGPVIDLAAEFGDINIFDLSSYRTPTSESVSVSGFFPLNTNAWWRLKDDTGTIEVKLEKRRLDRGRPAATISFVGPDGSLKLDVAEGKDGLFVTGIDGIFFGRELTGITFAEPKLWIPYDETAIVENDYILGTVKSEKIDTLETPAGIMESVIRAAVSLDGETHAVYLAKGVGVVGIDSYLLEAWDGGAKPQPIAKTPSKPRFEQGPVISIKVTGEHILTKDEVLDKTAIRIGETYTCAQIGEAMNRLEKSSKYISRVNYDIDIDGNLTIRVTEHKAHDRTMEPIASFNSIGGVGIGPELTVKSLVGPISLLKGSTQYHFANKEWTYRGVVEKSFFDHNRLSFGGTYRLEYESPMKWAIPENEMYMNAFLLGLETNYWYQVEGSTGYVSFGLGEWLSVKAEYFEDEYSSLKKHTNWSFFNHRHIKDDNLPLAPMDENRLAGVRIRTEFNYSAPSFWSELSLEAEKVPNGGDNKMGEYTRYFGNYVNNWRFSLDSYLKIRFAGGYSKDLLPAPRAFNLGGLNTLRGYDYQSIPDTMPFPFQYGGNRMALCNIEYLIDGSDDPGLILFADVGNVWMKGETARSKELKRDVGVSLAIGDIFDRRNHEKLFEDVNGVRVNWAVPVGNVPHVSHWTVNFCRAF